MIRKPHNLVVAYWDDCEYFYKKVLKLTPQKIENLEYISPSDKRAIRYAILSSFLFLEAFINAEYFDSKGYKNPKDITVEERHELDKTFIQTRFDDKWSICIDLFCKGSLSSLKGTREFQAVRKLKKWRNRLTHYKLHELMLIAHDVETISNAIEANHIAVNTLKWYYHLTGRQIPDWINRDVFLSKDIWIQ